MKIRQLTPNFSHPVDHLIGRPAVFRPEAGGILTGVIERFDGARAVIRFTDGRWAYSGYRLELVQD